MKPKWGRISNQRMWDIFNWWMLGNRHLCPFVMIILTKPLHRSCGILCWKWFSMGGCPCKSYSYEEVRRHVEKLLRDRKWIGQKP